MVREPYLTIDTKRMESMIIHCLIIIQGFIMKKFQKTMNYEPQKPDEKKIQCHKVKSVNTPAKLLNTNFTSDVNTTGTSLYSYLPDNRTKLSSSEINSAPYYSTCKLTMRFPDTPGYVTLGQAMNYEINYAQQQVTVC